MAKHVPLVFPMAGQNAIAHLQPTSSPSFLLTFTVKHLLHHMKSRRAQLPLQNKDSSAQHTPSQSHPVVSIGHKQAVSFCVSAEACMEIISASCEMQVVQAAKMDLISRVRGQPPAQHLRLLKRSRRSTSSTKRR